MTIEFLAEITIVGSLIFLGLREILKHRAYVQKTQTIVRSTQQKTDFTTLFDNIPTVLEETQKIYDETKAKNATEDQLKPIQSRIDQLHWVQNNEWWLRYAAPYFDKIGQNLIKMFR